MWLMFCRKASSKAVDPFGRALVGGLGAMIIIQAMLHIAVNMVILPPTGISMPFISAGGTGLVIMAGAASLIVSVTARRRADEIAENRIQETVVS
jgi:cell division protein FtsW (lipid II flippase)